jgi:hypothetical protein
VVDQKKGNAALLYHMAAELYPDHGGEEDVQKKVQDWLDLPIDQVPMAEADEVLTRFRGPFHQIELASLRDRCEWEMPMEDGFAMLMPGLSTYRNLARAMGLRLRMEVSRGQVDQALQTLKQGLCMGKNVAHGQTLIQGLVGIAITSLMLKEVEPMFQRADFPNLYWALTSLPVPLIDLRTAMEYEQAVLFMEFPGLRNLDKEVLTPEKASALVNDFWARARSLEVTTGDMPVPKVTAMAWVMLHYTDAKAYLAGRGMAQARIEAMPAAQAVMQYQLDTYLEVRDRLSKWFSVPYPVAQPHLEQASQEINRVQGKDLKINLFVNMLPALSRVAFLQARLDRQVALLRTIEAIRMYAADYGSQMPQIGRAHV